jgi:hypothetical protein
MYETKLSFCCSLNQVKYIYALRTDLDESPPSFLACAISLHPSFQRRCTRWRQWTAHARARAHTHLTFFSSEQMFAMATMDRVMGVADDLRSMGGAGGVVFIVVYVMVRRWRRTSWWVGVLVVARRGWGAGGGGLHHGALKVQ